MKNFAFLLDTNINEWSLAPAYDLIFSSGPGGEHSMTLAGEGKNPKKNHMLCLAAQAGISGQDAVAIMDEVKSAVATWPQFASQAGMSSKAARTVQKQFLMKSTK